MTPADPHALAAPRQRRIIFQDDIPANDVFRCGEVPSRLDKLIAFYMSRLEAVDDIEDGFVRVPDPPGLGIEIDAGALRRYRVP